jgi:hypothetical protein
MARNNRKNEGAPAPLGWLDNAHELPRADIEMKDRAAKRQKFFRRSIVGIVYVAFPLSMLCNFAVVPKVLDAKPVAAAQQSQLTSETKPAAMLAVQTWLAQNPSPLPGGQLLSWDGVDIQAQPEISVNPDNGQTTEKQGLQLHHMTVAASTGQVFDTTVQVGYSKFRGAQVIGEPTLIPRAPDDKAQWPNLTSWPDLTKVTASDAAVAAVNTWVEAFTSGNPDKLRLAVGDPADNRSYVPLSQVTATAVNVPEAAARIDPKADTNTKPSEIIARVSFAVQWQGQDLGRSQTPSRVSYDVLIKKADTAAPVVVAWGGVGTGENLSEYMNAVDGRKITSDGVDKSVSTASPSVTAPEAPAAPASAPPAAKPATPAPSSVPTVGAAPKTPTTGK